MNYQHQWIDVTGTLLDRVTLPVGKVVCVGRNYAAHAKELNNPVPESPLLFMKPATSLVSFMQPIRLPQDRGSCHFEAELALIIGEELKSASNSESLAAIAGVGLALDLTLRDQQLALKQKGHPWEVAKAFDGACPITPFMPKAYLGDVFNPDSLGLIMHLEGALRQRGFAQDMLVSPLDLLSFISHIFTLSKGDVVLTGTPAGVGPLSVGQHIELKLLYDEQVKACFAGSTCCSDFPN